MRNRWNMIWIAVVLCMTLTGCSLPVLQQDDENKDLTIQITVESTEADSVFSVNAENSVLKDLPEKDLVYLFGEKTNENIIADYYGDFDHDGIHEAFVVTGEVLSGPVDNAQTIYGQLWLVDSANIQLAAEDFSGMSVDIEVWKFDNRDYLVASKDYITGNLTYLWTVSNGTPRRNSVSGLGDIRNDNGVLHVVQTKEDAMIEDGEYKGKTMKYYDMYYDGSFKEYGAIVIPQSRFMEYEGAEDIMNKLETDFPDAGFSILYHNNHVIYINIQHQMDMIKYLHSAIVDIDEETDAVTLREVIEGNYDKALLKEIAVYPSR